jgi:glycosyltransferase involved in cell wall biosynthesis
MVAFHFPPMQGSSGMQRTLRFGRYLPEFGWEPIVLTVQPRAYERTDQVSVAEIPSSLEVHRAFGIDAARHLAIGGRYPRLLARPDRWVAWWPAAVACGLRLARQRSVSALWSTYPIATAHKIGHTLHRLTGLPWVADFRDPMIEEEYPQDPVIRASFQAIEKRAVTSARFSVFTAPGAERLYRERYPGSAQTITVIENGFDEESFEGLSHGTVGPEDKGCVLVHSGIVYPSERDPSQLFAALRGLRDQGRLDPGRFLLRFRAPGHDSNVRELAARFGVAELIEIAPPLTYREALLEMTRARGLVVLQGANCDQQIPAKLYEYLRAGRPILGLATGDTADVLRAAGIRHVAPLGEAKAIAAVIERFIADLDSGVAGSANPDFLRRASRRERTRELALLLDRAVGDPGRR